MPNLFTVSVSAEPSKKGLTQGEINSIIYHDLFDYPLNFADLIKWKSGVTAPISSIDYQISSNNNYYFIEGHEGITYKRVLRERVSNKKLEMAHGAAKVLSLIPSVKMVAVTGSLAMQNSTEESDIDLLIITKKGTLWSTRLFAYSLIRLFGIKLRKPNDNHQKDELCLNMWIDESDLPWKKSDRNIYTAHEIAQILPLVNKNNTYEKFLFKNKWILDFWPNAAKLHDTRILGYKDTRKRNPVSQYLSILVSKPIEKIAYKLQYDYMKSKITREVITPTRAFFHPQDWGRVVLDRLRTY